MTDTDLRQSLRRLADEVVLVDMGRRVAVGTRRVRRRRRLAVAAVAVLGLTAIGVSVLPLSRDSAPPPASRRGHAMVDLESSPVGGVTLPVMAVSDLSTGDTWLVEQDGRSARLPDPAQSFPGGRLSLSSRAGVVTTGAPGGVTLVRTADGSADQLPVTEPEVYAPAVSPTGHTLAYARAKDDGTALTLRSLTDAGVANLALSDRKASGDLLPVSWSEDGDALLVLDSAGITRVRVAPSPVVQSSSYLSDPVVLAHGWAAAPDLSQVLMAQDRSLDDRLRRWHVLDAGTGRPAATLTRPLDERLIGWTPDDHLVWWRQLPGRYQVATTDLTGRHTRLMFTVASPSRTLTAVWTADGP